MVAVYVASPLGFSTPTRHYYETVLLPALGGHEVLDPWAGTPDRTAAQIGADNEAMIRRADVVLAVLDGTDVDSGTAAEIGFAAALGVPVVGWRSDWRQAGDHPDATVNLQVQHWLASLHSDLGEAVAALARGGT